VKMIFYFEKTTISDVYLLLQSRLKTFTKVTLVAELKEVIKS